MIDKIFNKIKLVMEKGRAFLRRQTTQKPTPPKTKVDQQPIEVFTEMDSATHSQQSEHPSVSFTKVERLLAEIEQLTQQEVLALLVLQAQQLLSSIEPLLSLVEPFLSLVSGKNNAKLETILPISFLQSKDLPTPSAKVKRLSAEISQLTPQEKLHSSIVLMNKQASLVNPESDAEPETALATLSQQSKRLPAPSAKVERLLAEMSQLTPQEWRYFAAQQGEPFLSLVELFLSLVSSESDAELKTALAMSSQQSKRPPAPFAKVDRLLAEISQLTEQDILALLAQQALFLVKGESDAEPWPILQNNLGDILAKNPSGNRAEDLEQAIHNCKKALQTCTKEAFPEQWAAMQMILAAAYRDRIRGRRAENLEQAIFHAKQALQVCTKKAFPELWAITQNVLAAAYSDRIRGERALNLEQAIFHAKQALQVFTQQAVPELWATTQHILAYAYSDRIRGERAENLEQAIHHDKQALQVFTRQAFPEQWAGMQNNLATNYTDRYKGGRAENIEQAIEYLELALQVFTRQAFPKEWARTQHNLAKAYTNRIRGERAENLEQAIFHAEQALQVYTNSDFPEEWARMQSHLPVIYRNRIKGERAKNLEQAIFHAEQALQVYTKSDFPEGWAIAQQNLANAYNQRIRGEPAENLEQAIYHYKQASQVFTKEAFPERWATTQNNLANAYSDRIRGEPAENLEQAIHHCKQSLQVYTQKAYPYQWATTHNNLADSYVHRIKGKPAKNLEQAIYHFKLALEIRTREAFPEKWATTQKNLAVAYDQRIKGIRYLNLEQSIFHAKQALEVYTPTSFPQDCRDMAYFLGLLLYGKERYNEAPQAFEMAHQAIEALRGEVTREGGKKKLAEENADLYARLVFCCLHEGDKVAGFKYTTAGKGRTFVDTLASVNILTAIKSNPTLANDPLLEQYRSLSEEMDNLRIILNSDHVSPDDNKRLRPELEAHLSEYDRLWEDLTFKYPHLTATETAPSLTASEAMTLAADLQATLVEYVEHAGGWSAFVVTKDRIEHVSLDKVNDKLLTEASDWIKTLETKTEASDWIKTLETKSAGNSNADPERRRAFGLLITRKHLTGLHDAFIAPLQAYLPSAGQAERLIIAPFGALHQLPMGAAQNPDTKAYLSQAYTLTVTPTLAALRVSLDEARKANWQFSQPKQPLHVAHAGRQGMTNLLEKVSDSEAEMAKMFPKVVKLLSSQDANLTAVAKHASGRDLIHFYCHGIFEPDNPNQSGLLLHDGFLTVQRIITDLDLSQTNLTALAACESGRVGVTQGEELVGLIQALLTSGSKAVVATLWKVNESATQAFFQHFYCAIKAGHSPAEALSHATQAIRQTEDWEHPYFWAAFQISGLAHQMAK